MSLIPVKLVPPIGRGSGLSPAPATLRALVFGVVGFVCGLLAQLACMEASRPSPAVQIWIGLLPMHVGACGAASMSLLADTQWGGGWRQFGLGPPPRSLLGLVPRTLAWVYPLVTVITVVAGAWWSAMGFEPSVHPLFVLLARHQSLAVWVALLGAAAVIAPLTEEVLFRLILRDALALRGIEHAAVWTSLVFALLHLQPEQMPGLFVLALVLQRLRRVTGSLWAPLLTHVGFNVLSLLFLALQLWFGGELCV